MHSHWANFCFRWKKALHIYFKQCKSVLLLKIHQRTLQKDCLSIQATHFKWTLTKFSMYRSGIHVLWIKRTSSDKLKKEWVRGESTGCAAEFKCGDLLRLVKPDSVICQAGKTSGTTAKFCLFPWCDLVPQNHAALQRMDILRCQVKGTDLSLLSARSGPEQEHFQSSTMIAVTNSTVKRAEHLHGDFRKVLPKQHLLYTVAPGVWLRQQWDGSYDLCHCKTTSLFMGEWKSAESKAFMLRESR